MYVHILSNLFTEITFFELIYLCLIYTVRSHFYPYKSTRKNIYSIINNTITPMFNE